MRAYEPPFEPVKDAITPGENHQLGALQRRSVLDLLDDLVAVEPGQTQIDHYEIRYVRLSRVEPAQGFYSVGEALDVITCTTQASLQNFADHERVINDHHKRAHPSSLSSS